MADDYRGWEFLTGVLLGSGVGVATALLLAPHSGRETRDVIRERGLELKSRVEDVGEEGLKRAEDLGDEARHRAGQAQKRGRLVIKEQGTRFQEAIDQGVTAYKKNTAESMASLVGGKRRFSYLDRFSVPGR